MSAFSFPAPTSCISARCSRENPVREKPVGASTFKFTVCARSNGDFVATSNTALFKNSEKRCSAARRLLPVDRCERLARRSSAPFRFMCFRMLVVNRRVSDRCAGHGRVRSRVVVVAEEDEVRGSRRRPDTSCSARPTSTNCLIFRRTRSSR